jgi:hypothetical protein
VMLLIKRPWGTGATLTKAASSPASIHRGSASATINGVNDLGDIVGFFTSPIDAVIGFVGTPVPEPSGCAMMLVGVAGLGSLGYRTACKAMLAA